MLSLISSFFIFNRHMIARHMLLEIGSKYKTIINEKGIQIKACNHRSGAKACSALNTSGTTI